MSQADLASRLNEAIALINARQFAEARAILLDLSRQYPDQEAVWMWLSASAERSDERIGYLQRVLAINPRNEKARAALEKLGVPVPDLPGVPEASATPVTEVPNLALPSVRLTPQTVQLLELAAIILLSGLAVFFVVFAGGRALQPILNPPTETPTRTATLTPTATVPSLTPTNTASLPPTWTPAPTITPRPRPTLAPTLTPRPTFTPIPTRTPTASFTPPPTETYTPSATASATDTVPPTATETASETPTPTEPVASEPTETPTGISF